MGTEATQRDIKPIAEWRHMRDMTQFQLASLSGVGLSTVIAAENGTRIPRADNALKIAKALGVSVEDIKWGRHEIRE